MPQLKFVTVAYDAKAVMMPAYLRGCKMAEDIACVDVGVLKLKPETTTWKKFLPKPSASKVLPLDAGRNVEVFFKHYRLAKAWKKVQSSLSSDEAGMWSAWRSCRRQDSDSLFFASLDADHYFRTYNLDTWSHLFDVARKPLELRPAAQSAEGILLSLFESPLWNITRFELSYPQAEGLRLPTNVRDLSVAKHGEDAVKQFTELVLRISRHN
jgi:hypothetical protein